MDQSTGSSRNFRLLTIALQACEPPVELARLLAQPGVEWVGHATNCDDGLRQALMTYPDVIILPLMEFTIKLLRLLTSLRGEHFAPLVVAVTPKAAFLEDLRPCEGAVFLRVEQLYQDGLAVLLRSLLAAHPLNDEKNRHPIATLLPWKPGFF